MIAEGQKIKPSEMWTEIMRIVRECGMPMDPLFVEWMKDVEEESMDDTACGLSLSLLEMMYKRARSYLAGGIDGEEA